MKPKVKYEYINRGCYQEIWDYQQSIHRQLIDNKRTVNKSNENSIAHHLLLCEHNPVFTLGKSGSESNLLLDQNELFHHDIEYFKINRGGDITFHGPGQITGYPILDMDEFYHDVHLYVRQIEEVIIRVLYEFGLTGVRIEEYTGVWLAPNSKLKHYRKICAIGVHMSRWVTLHGFALNVNTNLDYFAKIIPCGIEDPNKMVTSLQLELGRVIDISEVCNFIIKHFEDVFQCEVKK